MSMLYKHEIGDAVNLTFKITNNGVGVTGQTPVVAVQRVSDSQWLNATKNGWQAGYNSIALTELDATNLAGTYGTDVTQFGGAEEKWRVCYKNTGTYAGTDTEIHEFVSVIALDSTVAKEATLANGTYGLSALNTDIDTLLTRIVGTLATGTHSPQSGDVYPIVNNGTYGNSALNTDLDTLLTRATELRLAELDPANLPTDIAAVKGDTAAILDDTGTAGVVIPQAQADKVWNTTTRAITDKAGFSLAADQSSVTVGTVNALGTQAKADVNAEVDAALNTAIPGSPTADSINERVKAVDDLTQAAGAGDLAAIKTALTVSYLTVQADGGNSTLQFKTDLTSTVDDFYKVWLKPRTGGLTGAGPRKVSTYNGTTKIVTLTTPFTSAPAAGDIFDIIAE